jgi:hypothetical protein
MYDIYLYFQTSSRLLHYVYAKLFVSNLTNVLLKDIMFRTEFQYNSCNIIHIINKVQDVSY